MFIYVHFLPHANSSGQASGQKIKKCIHYIYTKYPFFIFKKCTHYIYTRNYISAGSSPSIGPTTTLPSLKPAGRGRNRPNHYSSTQHFAGIYNAAKPSNHNATTTIHQKEVHAYPAAGIRIFFRPLFPLPSKRQTWSIHPTVEEKKREKGV